MSPTKKAPKGRERDESKTSDGGRAEDLPTPVDIDDREYVSGWYDATLDADHWFTLEKVSPDEAALLLCGYNPHESDALEQALRVTTPHMAPNDLKIIRRRFEDAQDWINLAKRSGLRHSRWVDEYQRRDPIESGSSPIGGPVRWTPERLRQLEQYRKEHNTKKAAAHFGIHESRVRKLLPGNKLTPTANVPFPSTPKRHGKR
jgi:hypothetical protein